jgi:succinate-acetate transporter protein
MMATHTENPHPTELAAPAGVSIANPGPLGLAAFALTTFVLSCANADILSPGLKAVVLSTALFYGGAVQVLAGMWEFRRGNTFAATAFSSYGAFWMAYWGMGQFFKVGPTVTAADRGHAIGFFLLGWTIFTAIMLIASLRTNGALIATFTVLTVTFLLLALGDLNGNEDLVKFGGYLGVVTAFLAWYACAAEVINETWKRPAVPLWKIG